MVGVPALWELLHRRIKTRLRERSEWVGNAAELLMKFNSRLRDKTPLNLGSVALPSDPRRPGRAAFATSSAAARP